MTRQVEDRELRADILVDAWRFFARLWDGGAGVTFGSDVVGPCQKYRPYD